MNLDLITLTGNATNDLIKELLIIESKHYFIEQENHKTFFFMKR